MHQRNLDRRDFHKLTTAALSGLAAGALGGCSKERPVETAKVQDDKAAVAAKDVHLCRGLNDCKGLGKDGKNDCRGQGVCATAREHSCGGQNDCKGLGGCGEEVGANECKGKGGCHVPLMDSAWDKLRQRKETEWKAKMLDVGSAPPKGA